MKESKADNRNIVKETHRQTVDIQKQRLSHINTDKEMGRKNSDKQRKRVID